MPITGLVWHWMFRFRSAGLIAVGIADNSVIPMPGSLDVFTIWLAASQPHYWPFYAAMATAGALIGGYITYAIARKGGKEALESKLSKKRVSQLYRRFERWGFWGVVLPAILPPPFPIVPFLLAAGALQYPPKRFIGSLALGRAIRFSILAGLGAMYGTVITNFFSKYYKPALIFLVSLSVIAGILALIGYYRRRKGKPETAPGAVAPRAA